MWILWGRPFSFLGQPSLLRVLVVEWEEVPLPKVWENPSQKSGWCFWRTWLHLFPWSWRSFVHTGFSLLKCIPAASRGGFSCPGFSWVVQWEVKLLVVSWSLFFFFSLSLCLLGGLVQAALPQGFRAIFRDTVLFVWRRQCRAEKADSPVMLPKFKPDMKQRSYRVEPSYLLYDLEMIQPCAKCVAITRSSSYDYILRCRLESVSRVRYMNGSLERTSASS